MHLTNPAVTATASSRPNLCLCRDTAQGLFRRESARLRGGGFRCLSAGLSLPPLLRLYGGENGDPGGDGRLCVLVARRERSVTQSGRRPGSTTATARLSLSRQGSLTWRSRSRSRSRSRGTPRCRTTFAERVRSTLGWLTGSLSAREFEGRNGISWRVARKRNAFKFWTDFLGAQR